MTALPTKDMPLLHAKQMESGNWLWTGPDKNAVKSHVSLCSSKCSKMLSYVELNEFIQSDLRQDLMSEMREAKLEPREMIYSALVEKCPHSLLMRSLCDLKVQS